MDINILQSKYHADSGNVKHAFTDERLSVEHSLMTIVSDISELVKARDYSLYTTLRELVSDANSDAEFRKQFQDLVLETVEDRFADIVIHLLDISDAIGVDFSIMKPCLYYRAFSRFPFSDNAFALVKGLCKEHIIVEKRLQFAVEYVVNWTKVLNVDIDWHIFNKLRYNKLIR